MRTCHPHPSPTRRGRLRPLDLAILVGIVAVVVIVSLPRLSAFARQENEVDAGRMVRRLAALLEDESLSAAPPQNILELFERLPRSTRRQFEDQSVAEGGRLFLRHGYYFEFLRVPAFAGDPGGVPAIRAWPERPGSAEPAFLGFAGAGVLRHRAPDPAVGGIGSPPQIASPHLFDLRARGWETVNATADRG